MFKFFLYLLSLLIMGIACWFFFGKAPIARACDVLSDQYQNDQMTTQEILMASNCAQEYIKNENGIFEIPQFGVFQIPWECSPKMRRFESQKIFGELPKLAVSIVDEKVSSIGVFWHNLSLEVGCNETRLNQIRAMDKFYSIKVSGDTIVYAISD